MRINNNSNVGRLGRGAKTRSSGGVSGKFQPGQTPQAAAAPQSRTSPSIHGVDSLLALQEVGTPSGGKRKRAVRRGNSMIDILEDIRIDLLAGGLSDRKLQNLLKLVREKNLLTGNANLDQVLDDIELRARVELAKRGLVD